jgi:hypothetical protein
MEPAFVSTIDLPGGSLLPRVAIRGDTVRILRGRVWLTEEGRPGDVFLNSGEQTRLSGSGLAVIEALGPARIELVETQSRSAVSETVRGIVAALIRSARLLRPLQRAATRWVVPRLAGGTARSSRRPGSSCRSAIPEHRGQAIAGTAR